MIGATGAALLLQRIEHTSKEDGVARFLLDKLTSEQVVTITRALLADPRVEDSIKIAIPRSIVGDFELPQHVITDERTVAVRHAECDKPILLMANADDDQGASLGDVTLIGTKQLIESPDLWVEIGSRNLSLGNQKQVWIAALSGLVDAGEWTLPQFANYVSMTRNRMKEEGLPLVDALGWALPALQLPRDSGYFFAIRNKGVETANRWKRFFQKLLQDRKPLIIKQRQNRQTIEPEELRSHFESVKDDISNVARQAIEAFINAPPGWNKEAAELADFEWERDGILQVFSGMKTRKIPLAQETINFFEDHFPADTLNSLEREYLEGLKGRSLKETRDEDRDFFETHRDYLNHNPNLRTKWERFIFGRAIECYDFLDGLLQAIERLFGRVNLTSTSRKLIIKSSRNSRSQWREINTDVALTFALRYRGLPHLLGDHVQWDVPHLFEYERLLEYSKKTLKKFKRNESTSRAALQIKFNITLDAGDDKETVQLIWIAKANAIGSELPKDIDRLLKRPFVRSSVARLMVSRKGFLQSVSLQDVTTLQPAFGHDAGSLVSRAASGEDISKAFNSNLAVALNDGRLEKSQADMLQASWDKFSNAYSQALKDLQTSGYAADNLIIQAEMYGSLLETLSKCAPGDINRRDLWEPLLSIGTVSITGGAPAAIVAPWHPLRIAATCAKMRSVSGLILYLLSDVEVNFGDSRLFFADLRAEVYEAHYPEICVGYQGSEPVLLTVVDTVNDYSLMERPVQDAGRDLSDVDPAEAARQVQELLARYTELQPHKKSNLNVILYNCDASGLPIATVSALSTLQEQEEMCCNIVVSHRDRSQLSKVYSELIEHAEIDIDSTTLTETSRNFMSQLRIGVMHGSPSFDLRYSAKQFNLAFLHDVVARQAKEQWYAIPRNSENPSILDHIPSRWSYRRVTGEDELKATNYLTCPRQPDAGWAYVDAVACVVRRESNSGDQHYLPTRQISFQDAGLKATFDEAHRSADWVATYDDLLDKRQLSAQGINVIQYRRQRTHGRNVIVSSTSELNFLHVILRKRLKELQLGLDDERLHCLAKKMIDDANSISGNIVLRAAKRGVSAGELIGLVLSRALISEELGAQAPVAWFLLDDYAKWLGQREEGIADILALSVTQAANGAPQLRAIVTEAKYVDETGRAEAERKSLQQLRQTIARMSDALFGDPGRLDRDLWLYRISDLLLDGITAVGHSNVLETVRDGIRKGTVSIDLRGYSHVFIHSQQSDYGSVGQQDNCNETNRVFQETYTREGVRKLIKAYEAGRSLTEVRNETGELRVWESTSYRPPAPRINWAISSLKIEQKGQQDFDPFDYEEEQFDEPVLMPEAIMRPSAPVSVPDDLDLADMIRSRSSSTAIEDISASEWLKDITQKLRAALMSYNFQAKINGARLTPNAALIRLMGSDRLRIEDIESKRSALLTTHGLKLISVSPLPGEIVVGIAREHRQVVSMWDLWSQRKINRNSIGMNMSFVLGLKEIDGNILYLNLGGAFESLQQHEPHTLIAGSTGSGKSVLIQALLLDIAATNPSDLAHIYLIDPKMGVDYSSIEQLPHLQGTVIVEQGQAIETMEKLVSEMDRRYESFRKKGARDIQSYNIKSDQNERIPYIFLVHDEFAEWMMIDTYKDAITAYVSRLGVKARAAGIHLIFAAQRPDANVMPIQLRDNLGNRLILRVASVGTSEIALGMRGAEQLLGHGHLAAKLSGETNIIYAQAPFLPDDEIELVVKAIRNQSM